ncbi:MAG: hypothetical protein NC238_06740 [Dehalobacter sp.]|nr:hypothetical protein [Dehalobacter sp.]
MKKELISLCIGEIVASLTFILALISVKNNTNVNIDVVIMYPFCVLLFILFQGSYYWFYRLKMITGKKVNKNGFRRTYRLLKIIDLILILLYPVIIILGFAYDDVVFTKFSTLIGIFIYLFGIAEIINYFYVRLSYRKAKDIVALLKLKNLKKSSLNSELNK